MRGVLLQCVYKVDIVLTDATTETRYLYAEPHLEDVIPNPTQKTPNVASGVRTLSASSEGAVSVPDKYARNTQPSWARDDSEYEEGSPRS
jgi:hypothetical protein